MDVDKDRQSALHTARAGRLLGEARIDISLAAISLAPPSFTDFGASDPASADGAREFLAQHRMASPSYRPPQEQKRNLFRTDKKKQSALDIATWKFTKHEVACTFDKLLSSDRRVAPGTTQAVLSCAAVSSIDELWCHFQDAKLEQATKSAFRRSSKVFVPNVQPSWLDDVTQRDDAEYVQLICQVGVQQTALDAAFAVAMDHRSLQVMRILLSFGARPSGQEEKIRVLFEEGDIGVAKVLLSAPPAAGVMSTDHLRHSLATLLADEKRQSHSILLACLASRPAIVCPEVLLAALASQNVQSVAALLACESDVEDLKSVNHEACGLISDVKDAELRFDLFSLLFSRGLIVDGESCRQELVTDVRLRSFQLVDIMIAAGVAVDDGKSDAISYAVANMDLDMLERLQKGVFTRAAASALNVLPDILQEPQLLRLVDILAPRDLAGQALNSLLVRAVSENFALLVKKLIDIGASIEYKDCLAIRTAISEADIDALSTLLQGPCSSAVFPIAVSSAMSGRPRSFRCQAMEVLLKKEVRPDQLGTHLQNLIHEEGKIDTKLVQMLLRSGAPIDNVGDDTRNVVLHAARRCDLTILELLCDSYPLPRTLAQAVKIAYEARQDAGHDKALQAMALLLSRCAVGAPVNETLLAATFEGTETAIVQLLVDHGADANVGNGAAFAVALGARDPNLLRILCDGSPPTQATIESNIYTALDLQHYKPECLEIFLRSSSAAAAALNAAWDTKKLSGHPDLRSIIPCFLKHGLSVDCDDGVLLCLALQQSDIELLIQVLNLRPSIKSLSVAFERALLSTPRNFAYRTMNLLLETARSKEIGQSRALLQETRIALRTDVMGLRLLLRHMPDVDFDDGAAMSLAAESDTTHMVLGYFLGHNSSIRSLHRACLSAAGSSTLSPSQKLLNLKSLLNTRRTEMTDASHMLRLMSDSVTKFPTHVQLPELLIEKGAKVDFETFSTAIRSASPALFKTLWGSQTGTQFIATALFRETREANIKAERKYWIYELLLTKKVSNNEISGALVDGLRDYKGGNLDVLKLLLEHGALVGHDSCAAFLHALRTNSLVAVKLLSQYLLDDKTASVAFG